MAHRYGPPSEHMLAFFFSVRDNADTRQNTTNVPAVINYFGVIIFECHSVTLLPGGLNQIMTPLLFAFALVEIQSLVSGHHPSRGASRSAAVETSQVWQLIPLETLADQSCHPCPHSLTH